MAATKTKEAKKIALANQKGGVGKTTTAVSLGGVLAEMGYKVLLWDMDSQSNLTVSFEIEPAKLEKSIYNVLTDPDQNVTSVITATKVDNIQVVPARIELATVDYDIKTIAGRDTIIRRKIRRESLGKNYDWMIFDCGPNINISTTNALTAADYVLIPVQTEPYSLYGVDQLIGTIERIREFSEVDLEIMGIVATMYDPRVTIAKEALAVLQRDYPKLLMESIIRNRTKLTETVAHGRPINYYAFASEAAEDYRALAREVIKRAS